MDATENGREGSHAPGEVLNDAKTANAQDKAERAWRAVYEPVERAIVEEHERRVANRVRRQRERVEEKRRERGDLLEATEGFSVVWEREAWTYEKMVAWADGKPWILMYLARAVQKEAARLIDRLRHAERRPTYYEAENARRRALAAERRRIRKRTTTNPCPTREQILDGWLHRSESHEATIRFGSLIMDLECHLDNSLVRDDDGAIVGRRGGVKRWLQENIPALYLRYTTVMRHKAAAQKLRQIAELRDPTPASAIVAPPVECDDTDNARLRCGRNPIGNEPSGAESHGNVELASTSDRIAHAQAIWQEVVAGIGNSPTALMTRIDALLSPLQAAEDGEMLMEWKRRYINEITARTKSHCGRQPKWPSAADSEPRHRTV